MTATPTSDLARWLVALPREPLAPDLGAAAAQHLLDVIAGLYAGLAVAEAGPVVARFAGQPPAEAMLLAANRTCARPAAAGGMAALAHAAESDPIHAPTAICAGAVTVPVALALASPAASGRTMATAIVGGYETAIRIGQALGSARLLARGWWPTAICGGAGAAATASVLLGLDPGGTRDAIGLALVHAGGLSTGGADAPAARNLLCGNVVRLGVEAALAAQAGIAGPGEPLIGPRGFLGAFADDANAATVDAAPRAPWAIQETSLKPYPCALQALGAIEATRSILAREEIAPGAVERVTVELPRAMQRIVDRPGRPASWLGAAASLQFQLAMVLLGREPSPRAWPGLDEAGLAAAMSRITVIADPGLDRRYPREWPARVTLAVRDGATHRLEIGNPRGHPERPIRFDETAAKLARYAEGHLAPASIERLVATVRGLDGLADATRLVDLLSGT